MKIFKELGKFFVLAYFFVIFVQMVNTPKVWELKLVHVFSQVSIAYNKATGLNFWVTGKTFASYAPLLLQFSGTLGLLFVFSGFYGERAGLILILFVSLTLNTIAYLPISISGYKDLSTELLNALQLIAANSGLLWLLD